MNRAESGAKVAVLALQDRQSEQPSDAMLDNGRCLAPVVAGYGDGRALVRIEQGQLDEKPGRVGSVLVRLPALAWP